jgi:hypothetical protein
MKKKGVELSMNVIIIAAIGLLVLIILAVLVINSSGRLQQGVTGSCAAKSGVCRTSCNPGEQPIISGTTQLCDTGMTCCGIFNTNV